MIQNDSSIVRVNRETLIRALKANREKHVKEYNIAIVQFWKDVAHEHFELADAIVNGKKYHVHIKEHVSAPQSFEKDYDRAIQRYENSVDDNILLNETQFNQFFRDEWQWSGSVTNTLYASKVR
jgi:hypothetical protein